MANILKGKLVAAKSYDSAGGVKVRFELTNGGPVDLYVLKWFTPLEGLYSDCFRVTRGAAKRVPYDGPMVKRGEPGPNDYILVPAGGTVAAEVDVADSYAISTPADYQLELNLPGIEHLPVPATVAPTSLAALAKTAPKVQAITGGKAKFKVTKGPANRITRGTAQRAAAKALAKAAPSSPGAVAAAAALLPPTLTGGTAAQKAAAKKAHKDGYDLCVAALAGLANNPQYKEWFGAHTAARMTKVKAVLTKVRNRMQAVTFTYDLTGTGCGSGVFAYTYKGGTTIWFCDAFWTAPPTGTDSKAGTVLHEHSHSDANTDDVTYGQTKCLALAASKPNDAVRNADSYEYYSGG